MEGEARQAYLTALRMLGRRALSVQELTDRLQRRGVSPQAAGQAAERLIAEGGLDDSAYARAYVHDRLLFHPVGRRRLRIELLRRGIAAAEVEAALAAVDQDKEEELARSLLARTRPPSSPEEDRRLRARLLRRGFSPDTVRRVLGRPPEPVGEGSEC